MSWIDPEFRPDPNKTTLYSGVIFNPWVNIPVCIALTLGCGAMLAWFVYLYQDTAQKPPYEDQGLDLVGVMIGIITMCVATLAMVVVTILTIRWWNKRIREHRQESDR